MSAPFISGIPIRTIRIGTLALVLAVSACGGGQTGLGLDLVPPQQVEAMGMEAWQTIRAETPPSRNGDYQRRARDVANRVIAGAGGNPAEWEVLVFEGEEINAFALPGKKIGVYEGMMRTARGDDALATVIAHEVAHNVAAHPAERLSSQVAAEAGLNIAGALLGSAGIAQSRAIAGILGAGVQYGVLLPYSRNQELEADRLGLRYMAQAGYDPRAAIAFWQDMQRAGGPRPPTFLSTHPAPEQRIQQIEALIPEVMAAYRR